MTDETDAGSASCLARTLVGGHPVDPETARDVARFRRAERVRLVAARMRSVQEREAANVALAACLD